MILWKRQNTWVENYINCFKGREVGGLDYMGAEETRQGGGTFISWLSNLHDRINFTVSYTLTEKILWLNGRSINSN